MAESSSSAPQTRRPPRSQGYGRRALRSGHGQVHPGQASRRPFRRSRGAAAGRTRAGGRAARMCVPATTRYPPSCSTPHQAGSPSTGSMKAARVAATATVAGGRPGPHRRRRRGRRSPVRDGDHPRDSRDLRPRLGQFQSGGRHDGPTRGPRPRPPFRTAAFSSPAASATRAARISRPRRSSTPARTRSRPQDR